MRNSETENGCTKTTAQQLSEAVNALRSDDVLTQNRAVEQFIQLGSTALPELLRLFKEPKINQPQAMYALSQIADKQATDAFRKGLNHDNEYVRAYAAQGLVNINCPEAIDACLQTINDGAYEAHLDISPAVIALADMGLVAVPSLLKLLIHDDEMTRLHSQRALEILINKRHGFIPGQGFISHEDENKARAEWLANGDYDYSADSASRIAAIARWQQWLDSVEE